MNLPPLVGMSLARAFVGLLLLGCGPSRFGIRRVNPCSCGNCIVRGAAAPADFAGCIGLADFDPTWLPAPVKTCKTCSIHLA